MSSTCYERWRYSWLFLLIWIEKIKNSGMHQFEKILKNRNRKSKRQLLVLWLRYNSDFDSWMAAEVTISIDFYATFLSNVSDALFDVLNKTSDCWTKLFPAIKFEGSIKLLLLIVFLKVLILSYIKSTFILKVIILKVHILYYPSIQ